MSDLLRKAFRLGFEASGEGYNGEYPFEGYNVDEDEEWCEMRDEALAPLAAPVAAPVQEHPDDLAVDRFAAAMKTKLAQKRKDGRGGWEDKAQCSAEFLSQLLREHVEKGDPLDVGNLSMMLHQRGERITTVQAQELEVFADEDCEILFRVSDKWMISIDENGVGYTYFDGEMWQPGSFQILRSLISGDTSNG